MGVETSFGVIEEGQVFPTLDMSKRNARYRMNESRREGTYADNKMLVVRDSSGIEKTLPWKILKLNKFKLYTNKMDSLIFSREPIIKGGDSEKSKLIVNLVERTQWVKGIRTALRNMETYGDAPIKTHSKGVSAFSPVNAFKVVDEHNKDEVKGYVLVDYIKDNRGIVNNVRFETHLKGYVYEIVYEYSGSSLGKAVDYNYNGRVISLNGIWYETALDEFMIQWASCDVGPDGYGQSPYEDFASLVHEAERRQTLEIKVLDAHTEPTVAVAMGTLQENEETGVVGSSDVLGNLIEIPNGGMKPEYITWDGKLDSNEKMLDNLFSEIYEVTELGKTFMTGEYTGNISEESLNNLVNSAVDRGNRHVWDIYYEVRKSLYVLCRLNGIDVSIQELDIIFQVGQSDSIKTISEVINSRVGARTLSVQTALQRYDGLTEQQAIEELNKIKEEGRK